MKRLFLSPFYSLLIICFFSLQGCSWICRFYIANTSNEAIRVEMKLMDSPSSFPIFHYPKYYYGKLEKYDLKKNGAVNLEKGAIEVRADTLDKFSHFRFEVPPHSAVEIGALQNDHYEKYNQYFINGRTFNIERILISEKKIEIVPSTFDNYFRKGKFGEIYFVL